MTIVTVGWSAGSLLGKGVFQSAPGLMGFASHVICAGVLLGPIRREDE
ncbi:MAG: hypothetical protein JSR66_17100 [Proteobacteria bacterium]|nr:hypothetical protein [Pseudomonadota bacterium]